MKNKGFTLAELLAVIAIIGLIAVVSLPVLLESLKKNDERKYQDFVKSIELSAERYTFKYSELFNLDDPGDSVTIKLSDLVKEGLISATLVNPETETQIDLSKEIMIYIEADYTKSYVIFVE